MVIRDSLPKCNGPTAYLDAIYNDRNVSGIFNESPWYNPGFMNRFGRILPALAAPLLNQMDIIKPDITVICDTSARPIGNAMQCIINSLGDEKLAAIPFAYYKISAQPPYDKTSAHLAPLVEDMRSLESATVIVVDDNINLSGAKNRFMDICRAAEITPNVFWTTLAGRNENFSAWPHVGAAALAPWRDQPNLIGIEYTDDLQPVQINDIRAQQFHEAIQLGADELVHRMRSVANS